MSSQLIFLQYSKISFKAFTFGGINELTEKGNQCVYIIHAVYEGQVPQVKFGTAAESDILHRFNNIGHMTILSMISDLP